VFEAEARLLQSRGHEVLRRTRDNASVAQLHPVRLAQRTVWNHEVFRELRTLIRGSRPSVMHYTTRCPWFPQRLTTRLMRNFSRLWERSTTADSYVRAGCSFAMATYVSCV
jgi:hypothetical protein